MCGDNSLWFWFTFPWRVVVVSSSSCTCGHLYIFFEKLPIQVLCPLYICIICYLLVGFFLLLSCLSFLHSLIIYPLLYIWIWHQKHNNKSKINKWKYIKLTSFFKVKGPNRKMKSSLQHGRKYLQTTHVYVYVYICIYCSCFWCHIQEIIAKNTVRELYSYVFFSEFVVDRQWHPTPVLLPGKSHGRMSLVGCSPWGR